ncbi:MAG: histidinol dehydrogenase [Treponema sp.]|jgi:histidinol dehydrogenase|nr:histidinol dehydrogenase [Treponema sp.]
MKIIDAADFDAYWKDREVPDGEDSEAAVNAAALEIIGAVRQRGDAALRDYAARFDKTSPEHLEVSGETVHAAGERLRREEEDLAASISLAADHIRRFAELQKKQLVPFEEELDRGLFCGQRVIPVERAAVYVPAGRFPLFSSVLMGVIPALTAGVKEIVLASPPMEDGLPDRYVLAAAALACPEEGSLRVFAMGGAQAIAALAFGTESIPRAAVITGPGNKYVAAAKRLIFGRAGIDFVAGPTDVLIITEDRDSSPSGKAETADLTAADMLAQAEHDPDARARVMVPGEGAAKKTAAALERRLAALPGYSRQNAAASLEEGGLIIVYHSREEAIRIANLIAPEHLELHVKNAAPWMEPDSSGNFLKNYGSLFNGPLSAEVLGDYSAGINHTLPTSGSARFTGGLSVRHFLKTPTTLRCVPGPGLERALEAAERMGRAEGLAAHGESAALRRGIDLEKWT